MGTPTKTFLHLVNSCHLPPLIIKKLHLKFKKERGKFYSSVPYDYSATVSKYYNMAATITYNKMVDIISLHHHDYKLTVYCLNYCNIF